MIGIFLAAALLLAVYILYCTFVLRVKHYKLKFETLPEEFDGFKILQLSDLHDRVYGDDNAGIVKIAERENPDIIIMTGDMADRANKAFRPLLSLTRRLCDKFRIYYVRGNHEADFDEGKAYELLSALKGMGVTVLDNGKATVGRNGGSIDICGLYIGLMYYNKFTDPEYRRNPSEFHLKIENMKELLGEKQDTFTVLLAHNPQYFDVYAEWGADVVFSGHMHGGMIRLPFAGGVLAPDRSLFPKYCDGRFVKNRSQMVVSRGTGNGKFPVRFFNNPEITVTVLSKSS